MQMKRSRRGGAWLFAILLIGAWCPCRAPAQNAAPAEERVFKLRVVDPQGAPVAAAQIWIVLDSARFPAVERNMPRSTVRTQSNPQGNVTALLPAHPANVSIWASGFAPFFQRGVDLTRDETTVLRLERGQTISGQVKSQIGMPVVDAKITARRTNFPLEYMDEFTPTVLSEEDGAFRIENAASGTYVITAETAREAESQHSFAPVTVTVSADAPPEPIVMIAEPGVLIRGKFVGEVRPREDQEITLSLRRPAETRVQVRIGADGAFTVPNIPAGASGWISLPGRRDHTMVITVPESHQKHMRAGDEGLELKSIAAGTYDGIEVSLPRSATLSGTVTDGQGNLLPGVQFIVNNRYIYRSRANGIVNAKLPPNQDAILEIYSPGTKFEPKTYGPYRAGEGETIERTLVVKTLPPPVYEGEVVGSVVDARGNPVAGALVHVSNRAVLPNEVVWKQGTREEIKTTWRGGTFDQAVTDSDEQGKFRFDLLHPGATDVWAIHPEHGAAFISRVPTKPAQPIELRLAPRSDVIRYSGTVLDSSGTPASGARVLVYASERQNRLIGDVNTNESGQFQIDLMPAKHQDEYLRAVIFHPEYGVAWRNLPMMSLADLKLQFQPQAALTGRIVDHSGNPVQHARVWLHHAVQDDFGRLAFYRETLKWAQETTTREDGTYEIRVPRDSTVALFASHPQHRSAEQWHIGVREAQVAVKEIKLPEAIVVEGIVRRADTRQPVAGALVIAGNTQPAWMPTAITDEQGRFRFSSVDVPSWRGFLNLHATLGDWRAPEWDGIRRLSGSFVAGDQIRDVEILLDRPYAWRDAEWRSQAGAPLTSEWQMAVLESGNSQNNWIGHLTVYDSAGAEVWRHEISNVSQTIGGGHPLVFSPGDRSIWVGENVGSRLLKFSPGGQQMLEVKDIKPGSLCIDPKTGNVWVLVSGESIHGTECIVLSPTGDRLAEYRFGGHDIVYSAREDCFWIVGQQLRKVDRNGKTLAESTERFAWIATSLAVHEPDGSVWVAERMHDEVVGSQDRVAIFDSNAQLRRQIPGADSVVALHAKHGIAWARALDRKELVQLNLAGERKLAIPARFGNHCFEPDSGYLWSGGRGTLDRIDRDGRLVWRITTRDDSQKWICPIKP